MVDYNPLQDPGIPCVDAGMAFRKGNLLEIVDQTDTLWWQAKKLPCSSTCAGLVPSACMLKRSGVKEVLIMLHNLYKPILYIKKKYCP